MATQVKLTGRNRASNPQAKTKLVVAAIDFGTTYSGYAYSLKDDFEKDPLKIYANQAWSAAGEGLVTLKTPTTILFRPDGTFDSFGFEAEDKYVELAEDDKHKGWRYYKRFKMKLYAEQTLKLRRAMWMADDQGGKMKAKTVFCSAIWFLRDHLLKRLQERLPDLSNNDIHWVLTVPAIWQDNAKQFMREAANEAGISDDQLTLALEPEAAAVYCKEITVQRKELTGGGSGLASFNPGAKFLLLDLGGGTADITAHEVMEDGSLRELCSPSGGPWGGTVVDKAFQDFVKNICGESVLEDFTKENKVDQLEMDRAFELKKRMVCPSTEKVHLKLPNSLYETHEDVVGESLASTLKKSVYAERVAKKRDKLHIETELFTNFFSEPISKMVSHVEDLFRSTNLRGVETLLLVGGFSESEMIKDAFNKAFGKKNVIIPAEAGLAVLKGAVIYGHNTEAISSRVIRYTYGISTADTFNSRLHPASKMVIRKGRQLCEDIFKAFIRAGTTVKPGKTKESHTFNTPFVGSSTATIEVYKTESKTPVYIDDAGCSRVGEVRITVIGAAKNEARTIEVTMTFGSTELEVEAHELKSDNTVHAKFNFLN